VHVAHFRTLVANHNSVDGGHSGYLGDVQQDYNDTMQYFAKVKQYGLDGDESF
jgi:hypothetical protein